MAWVLEQLAEPDSSLYVAIGEASHPEDTRAWLQGVVARALHAAHDEMEREYRKLGTNLLQKEAEKVTPKDGV